MNNISLAGQWDFRLDPDDQGFAAHWEQKPFPDKIQIPGILQAQGYGDLVSTATAWVSSLHDPLWYLRDEYQYGLEKAAEKADCEAAAEERVNQGGKESVRIPFLSQPPRHYLGKAWYRREFEVSEANFGQFAYFHMECVKWRTTVWLDGCKIGEEQSLCVPHEFPLGRLEQGLHTLTVCVDNGILLPYRLDGHGISDALGAAWNGMAGAVELRFVPLIELKSVQIYPIEALGPSMTYMAKICLLNHTEEECDVTLEEVDGRCLNLQLPKGTTDIELRGLRHFAREEWWDEFSPRLQESAYILRTPFGEDRRTVSFGLRKAEVRDGKFWINGRQAYFRGTHFGGDYPLTGHPECGVAWWREKMRILKEWGMNFIRCHSYCPPEAAFTAADEEGVYLQVECCMWETFRPGEVLSDVAVQEARRILESFGNHPSFLMMSPSNEPAGSWQEPLAHWVEVCKALDNRRLYTAQSGWPYPCPLDEITGTDYLYFHRAGQKGNTMIRGYRGWHGGDYGKALEGARHPVICHELGQWCSYPDYSVTEEFKGYLKPGNYDIFRESLRAHGLEGMDADFAYHSGKLQALMYKEDLEANFRTPSLYGFELLDLHDYLGQGSALVGVLDAFWRPKGAIAAAEWREFCGQTVVLARIKSYVVAYGEELHIPVEVCHFGKEDLGECTISWSLEQGPFQKQGNQPGQKETPHQTDVPTQGRAEIVARGSWRRSVTIGKNQEVGVIQVRLGSLASFDPPAADSLDQPVSECQSVFQLYPARYVLRVWINGTACRNHWNLWGYPQQAPAVSRSDILCTDKWSEMRTALQEGRKVLFFPDEQSLDYACPPVPFRPVFWNAQMGPTWGRGMGILCEKDHPAFDRFPTDSYADWQWEGLLWGSRGFRMEHFSTQPHVLVRAIDEWNRNDNLALLFECKVGKGRLMVCTMPLPKQSERSAPSRWLLYSLLQYLRSERFDPAERVALEDLEYCRLEHNVLGTLGGKIFEERCPERLLTELMDGDGNTWTRLQDGYPYCLRMEWEKPQPVKGVYYLPRQDVRNHEGEVCSYRIEAWFEKDLWKEKMPKESTRQAGGEENQRQGWREVVRGELRSTFQPHRILFPEVVSARRLRFVVESGFADGEAEIFTFGQGGWHKKKGVPSDGFFAAAVLDVLLDREWMEAGSGGITESEAKTSTAEIDA